VQHRLTAPPCGTTLILPDQIRDMLIHENYLSQKDIEICLAFDIYALAAQPEHEQMRALHEVLRAKYGSDDASGAA
jgi:hypothetical protein